LDGEDRYYGERESASKIVEERKRRDEDEMVQLLQQLVRQTGKIQAMHCAGSLKCLAKVA
jgi:hypothetical protein